MVSVKINPFSIGEVVNGAHLILDIFPNKTSYKYLTECTCPLRQRRIYNHITVAFKAQCTCLKKKPRIRLDLIKPVIGTLMNKNYCMSISEWRTFLKEEFFFEGFMGEKYYLQAIKDEGFAQLLEDFDSCIEHNVTHHRPPYHQGMFRNQIYKFSIPGWYQFLEHLMDYRVSLADSTFREKVYKHGLQKTLDEL